MDFQTELDAAVHDLKQPPVVLAPLLLGLATGAGVQAARGESADEWVFGTYTFVLLVGGLLALRRGLALTGQRTQNAVAILPMLVAGALFAGLSEMELPILARTAVPMLVCGALYYLRVQRTENASDDAA